MAPVHLEQVANVSSPVGSPGNGLVVVDLDRVGRVEADDAMVLDEDAGHAVAGGGHDEAIVEADLERAGLDLAVPIEGSSLAQAEVPLADDAGRVAGLFEDRTAAWCGRAR